MQALVMLALTNKLKSDSFMKQPVTMLQGFVMKIKSV